MNPQNVTASALSRARSPIQKSAWLVRLFEQEGGGVQRVHAELQRWDLSHEEFSRVQAHVLCTVLERNYPLEVVEEFARVFRSVGEFQRNKDDTATRLRAVCAPSPSLAVPRTSEGATRPLAPPFAGAPRPPVRPVKADDSRGAAIARPPCGAARAGVEGAAEARAWVKKHSSDRLYQQFVGEADGGARGVAVLVVEADRFTRDALCAWLRAEHEVTGVSDGRAALRELQRRAFGLVVLDMQAPGRGDLEVLAHLMCQPRRVPVILCTGAADVSRYPEVKSYGPLRACRKPVAGFDLARQAGELLASTA